MVQYCRTEEGDLVMGTNACRAGVAVPYLQSNSYGEPVRVIKTASHLQLLLVVKHGTTGDAVQ